MQTLPIQSCLLAGLILSSSLLTGEVQAQFQASIETSSSQEAQRHLHAKQTAAPHQGRTQTPLIFNAGPATSNPTQRTSRYCGQTGKSITALVPPQGISLNAQRGVSLWISGPFEMAQNKSQTFQLTVSSPTTPRVFKRNYTVQPINERLVQLVIPPEAFQGRSTNRSDYQWQLTYRCPETPSAPTSSLSGVIGIPNQTITPRRNYAEQLQFYGANSHWFNLLDALINPPAGAKAITANELNHFLNQDTVRLGEFYPELAALILPKQTDNQSLGLQLKSLTNSSRLKEGLTPLNSSPELQKAAQDYADIITQRNCPLIHDCGGVGLSDRLKNRNIPTTFRAENIVKVPKNLPNPGKTAFDTLQNSWEHRRNSHVPEWVTTGIGVAETPQEYYFVQIFNQPQGLPSFESQQELILPPNSPTPRLDFEKALLKHSVTEGISLIEGKGLRNFAQFVDSSFIKKSNSPSASEISSNLNKSSQTTQKKTGIIYVVATKETLLIYLLVPQEGGGQPTVIRKTVPVSRIKVLGTAQQFRQRIINPTHATDFLPYATQLHHWIMDPIEAELEALDLDTLLFTMDDGLRSIPMAALHNGDNFLIERYSMALLPTFGLTETGHFQMDQQKILAMGITQAHGGLSALPAVKTELEEISKVFNNSQSKITLNEKTTVDQLTALSQSQKYGIIHLATHAQFHPQKAGQSFLQFWNRRLNLAELGSLGRQLQWDQSPTVEMLVMSACTTAMGDRTAELGFAGSAVLAGVKSTVANLWNVSDISSTAFMIDFYRNLSQSPTKTEGFRQTQLAMLNGQLRIQSGKIIFPNQTQVELPGTMLEEVSLPFSHPYYWAGHTVIGNWN